MYKKKIQNEVISLLKKRYLKTYFPVKQYLLQALTQTSQKAFLP